MKDVVLVAVGGAVGSVLRFLVQKNLNLSFPFGTFAVNVVGCFAAGWLLANLSRGLSIPVYLFLMTGFCGGFTTFSAYSAESLQMILSGQKLKFLVYTIASVTTGLLACYAGFKLFTK